MMKFVDRILGDVRDWDDSERNYREVLGAQKIEDFESRHLNARLDRHQPRWTRRTDMPQKQDGLWIYPAALIGVLMGSTRTSLVWQWSGQPKRVQPLVGSVG